MYKLLLLTDFSAASQHAIAFAQNLFADTATDFCLVHAFPLQPEMAYAGAIMLAEERDAAEQSMRDFRRTLTQQPVPAYHTYRTMVVLGEPTNVVAELLQIESFNLVVVGAIGTGNTPRLGSVATGLIRGANANVLVVPALSPIRPLQQLVLATDYRSVNNAESLGLLTDLAARKAAHVTLLTIQKPGQRIPPITCDYVEQALDTVQTDTYLIHDNNVAHGIDTYLDLHAVDLLVLLPHHKSLLDVLLETSVTRSLAYRPRVPLLSLYDETGKLPAPIPEDP